MATVAITPDQDVITAEIFIAAPPARVYQAITDPAQMSRWWGQNDMYRIKETQADFRVGGKWSSVGEGADGTPFRIDGEYLELDPPPVRPQPQPKATPKAGSACLDGSPDIWREAKPSTRARRQRATHHQPCHPEARVLLRAEGSQVSSAASVRAFLPQNQCISPNFQNLVKPLKSRFSSYLTDSLGKINTSIHFTQGPLKRQVLM